ncbi:MAG: PilZ domain-containing protein [Candidatus Acidiferrales bacterium]
MTFKRVKKDWDTARLALRIHSIRQIAVQYEGTDERIISRVPDVSTSGMFINTSRNYAEGAVLNLSFCLALSGLEVQARGEVRYSLPGVGIGVQFIDISENAIHSIEQETRLSRRFQRLARKTIKVVRRRSAARKRSKAKATPRKTR